VETFTSPHRTPPAQQVLSEEFCSPRSAPLPPVKHVAGLRRVEKRRQPEREVLSCSWAMWNRAMRRSYMLRSASSRTAAKSATAIPRSIKIRSMRNPDALLLAPRELPQDLHLNRV
jgi:hypothetical protein